MTISGNTQRRELFVIVSNTALVTPNTVPISKPATISILVTSVC